MVSPVEAYIAARTEVIETKKQIDALGAVIRDAGESVSDRLAFPSHAYALWKSADEIRSILDSYRSLFSKMVDQWEELPEHLQESLQPPPSLWPEPSPKFKRDLET